VLIVLPGVRENSSTLPKASPRSLVRDPHLGRRLRASEVGAVVGSALAAPYYGYGPYCPGHYYGPAARVLRLSSAGAGLSSAGARLSSAGAGLCRAARSVRWRPSSLLQAALSVI
jgi:hypothetical protein